MSYLAVSCVDRQHPSKVHPSDLTDLETPSKYHEILLTFDSVQFVIIVTK